MEAPKHDLQTIPPPQPGPNYPQGGYQPAQEHQLQTFPPPQPLPQYHDGGYQPAPAQFPMQHTGTFPPHAQPPGYAYSGQTGYQPITDTSTVATVVTAQPTTVTAVVPPEADHTPVAITALVLSIVTLICCSIFYVFPFVCTIPALILAIVAMVTRGNTQKTNAGVSIGLSIAVIVINVVVSVIIGILYATLIASYSSYSYYTPSYRYCESYYSSTYNTECSPVDYYTTGSCTYYASSYSTGSYCPT